MLIYFDMAKPLRAPQVGPASTFKVVLSGPAASGFASASATADMSVTFTFEAFP